MKILFNGKVYETEINEKGHVISKDGNKFFGKSEKAIVLGEIVTDETTVQMSTNAKTGRKETHPVTGYERLHGKATVFDDLRFPLGAKNIDSNSTRYAQDLFNGGITVNANARFPNEPIL